jgi:hypothetical protein
MPKEPFSFGGLDVTHPINRLPNGRAAIAANVRAYLRGGFSLRNTLTSALATISGAVKSLARLNDTTPAGPAQGYTLISTAGTTLFNNSTPVVTGLSGNQVSLVPFRPNSSVQPWMYVGDSAPTGSVTVAGSFLCSGMVKVRSDGLSRKMGVQEPPSAPTVSTSDTSTSGVDNLPATTYPWTNVGGKNPNFNFSHTSAGDGTAPVIIACPVYGSKVILTVTGTAMVNGATHSPGDAGPTSSTSPGAFITSPSIIVGAFTDGAGNVVIAPAIGPVNIGASVTLTVPNGATQLQVGVDSLSTTFGANSGSFTLNWTVTVSAIATQISTLGSVTAYYWGDSPHTGPVAAYIWKNPNDVGSGTARTTGTAAGSATNNSWHFDSTPEDPTVPVQWQTLDSSGSVVGSIVLFSPALESEGYQDFNACVVGSLFVPAAGTYAFTLQNKDQVMFGVGGGATVSGGYKTGISGQTMSVVSALPLVYVSTPNGTGGAVTQTINITFPGTGTYQIELDWDFWYHNGRSLILTVNSAAIPPLPQGVRTNVSYAYKYRASETGAVSNPSPESAPQLTPVLDNTVSSVWSPDPQIDKVDYYRQDAGLANYTYVATGPNDGLGGTVDGQILNTPIVDALSDTGAAGNQIMQQDDFEPFPSIDLPKKGVVNVSGGVITWVSGDKFNIRWLPGTIILIGSPTQLAYSFISRPTSTTTVAIPEVPDGSNLAYNIAEPILAAQPLPYMFGPTDNINFTFAVGDPLRPGTLYWCKGGNLDSAPDTNQQDVTDPSEALVNGDMSGGLGVVFSIKRAWLIEPNFFNALATVTGTSGSTWSLQDTAIERGLFIPRCVVVAGGGKIFFRVEDGIHFSPYGAGSKSITDDELFPLFPHESPGVGSSAPVAITRNGYTIYPPDDTNPDGQKFKIAGNYLYYDYLDAAGIPRTLVFDYVGVCWVWDQYEWPATVHATNQGESVQGTLVGCVDGSIRQMAISGGEVITGVVLTPAVGGAGWMHFYEITVEYTSSVPVSLTFHVADGGNGSYAPPVLVLPAAPTGTKYTTKVGANKWKWLQVQFASSDPMLAVYLEGLVLQARAWGTVGPYRPLMPFRPMGGVGGEG